MKRVSVAEARNNLPALIHSAERSPVEILRRGQPVAVLLSHAAFERLQGRDASAWKALQRFRASHDLESLDLQGVFDDTRDGSRSRAVKW
jgi:prevent-host-death family protein